MANKFIIPKTLREWEAREALRILGAEPSKDFGKSFEANFAKPKRSTIHSGPRIKRVPAKPKKRKVQPKFLKKNDGRVVCNLKSAAGKQQYGDWKLEMYVRDFHRCCICQKYVPFPLATFEHTDLRSGGRRDDRPEYTKPNGDVIRNGVAHGICNSQKGSKRK